MVNSYLVTFVICYKHVIYIFFASMVIPCRVDNYKVKSRLTNTVGCKCPPLLKQHPPSIAGLKVIRLDSSCS